MSNAFDKASLVMLPHAYEEGKLYSLKPTDRSGDFTFSRGTDTATRVNEQGYIEKETVNLLLQSNQFDTTWATSASASIVGGQSGYDGSSNAWLLSKNSGSQYIQQQVAFGGVNTFSVYIKAGTSTWVALMRGDGQKAFFDLNGSGALGSVISGITSKIESSGNGWFRCSFVFQNSTTNYARIYPAEGDNNISGTSGSIYIQNAMLNLGLVAQPYLETTTAPVYGGLTDNMPRLDYTDASCPSLLLEPSRTNLITQSEYLGGWQVPANYTNTTKTDKQGIQVKSIYGRAIHKSIIVTSGETYSVSFYAKKDTWEFFFVNTQNWDSSANGYTWFNLATGNVGTASPNHGTPTMTPEGNGWYRCTIYFSSTTDLSGNIVGGVVESNGNYTLGTNDQEAAFFTMAQFEQGSYPTSYIPTYGSTQTRDGEAMSLSNLQSNNVFGQNEGTVFVDWEGITNISNSSEVTLRTSSNVEQLRIGQSDSGAQYIADRVYGQGGIYTSNGVKRRKIAFKYSATGGLSVFEDGEKLPNTFANGDYSIDKFDINLGGVLRNAIIGFINFFPTALSDAECIALTQN